MDGLRNFFEGLTALGSGMAQGDVATSMAELERARQARADVVMQQQLYQAQMAQAERERRRAEKERTAMAALAPQVAAQMGMPGATLPPSLVGPLLLAQQKAAQPTGDARTFAWYQTLPENQKGAYLEMKRSMSPFAGMADFMSPLGAEAAKWTNAADQTPTPDMTPQQAAAAGFSPRGDKPTQKQEDTVAAALNMLDQEELMLEQEMAGFDPTARMSQAATYMSPLRGGDQEKWSMAAEQGTTAYAAMMSGADVTDEQRRQYRLEQYPVAGEELTTIEAKRRRRLQQMRNQLTARRVPKDNPVWQRLEEFEARLNAPEAIPDAPTIGDVEGGYEYIGGHPGDPNSWRLKP